MGRSIALPCAGFASKLRVGILKRIFVNSCDEISGEIYDWVQVTVSLSDFHTSMEESPTDYYHDDLGFLTEEDMTFIHTTLGRDILSVAEMNNVLNDPKLRKQVLDSPAILDALNNDSGKLTVSEYFYFTTLVRQVMLTAGLDSPEYTQNVATSLVRMSNMRRKLMERADSNSRYVPLNMKVLVEDGIYGSNLHITCRMAPYEMVLEGFLANVGAFNKQPTGSLLSAQGPTLEGDSL
jgi:hypothetical protein